MKADWKTSTYYTDPKASRLHVYRRAWWHKWRNPIRMDSFTWIDGSGGNDDRPGLRLEMSFATEEQRQYWFNKLQEVLDEIPERLEDD